MNLHNLRTVLLIGVATSVTAAPAFADHANIPSLPSQGKFSLTPNAGTAFTVGGDFVKSGSESISGSGTLGGIAVTGTGTLAVKSNSFSDVYDAPIQLGLSGNYGLTDRDEISAQGHWLHAEGKTFDAGTASFAGTINGVAVAASSAFQAKFDNYNEAGIDGGYKHFFDVPSASFHPYLGAALGAVHTDAVKVNLSSNGTALANGVHFYGAGWTWDAGLEAGFRYDLAPQVAIGLETGIRYVADLKSNHSDLNGDGGSIDNVNSGGGRWDIPVVAGVTIKF